MELYEQVHGTARTLGRRVGGLAPRVGILPGSGPDALSESFQDSVVMPSSEMGVHVAGVSGITPLAAGVGARLLPHEEVAVTDALPVVARA